MHSPEYQGFDDQILSKLCDPFNGNDRLLPLALAPDPPVQLLPLLVCHPVVGNTEEHLKLHRKSWGRWKIGNSQYRTAKYIHTHIYIYIYIYIYILYTYTDIYSRWLIYACMYIYILCTNMYIYIYISLSLSLCLSLWLSVPSSGLQQWMLAVLRQTWQRIAGHVLAWRWLVLPFFHWIGLREHLQEIMGFL